MAVSTRFPARLSRMVLLGVLLPACGGYSSPTGSTGGAGADVRIPVNAMTKTNTAFVPDTLTVSITAGTEQVTWYNGDYSGGAYGGGGVTHSLLSNDGVPTPEFNSGNLLPRHSFSHTFTVAGTYDYHCSLHPTMVGTIVVEP